MPEFLQRLSPTQRKILMFGVPVVVIAAIWSLAKQPKGDAAEGEGEVPADGSQPPTSGSGQSGIITGGTGSTVDSGALSEFLNSVGEALDQYRAEGNEAIAQLQAENETWREELEQALAERGNQEAQTPVSAPTVTTPPPVAAPKPVGKITLINTTSGRAAFTGPSGEGGFATKPDPNKYPGATSWKMPDGRVAWYVPGKFIDPGNVGALQNYAS
jgi:hypothetical protein